MSVVHLGVGPNPDGKDLPLGFGMELMQDAAAVRHYSSLSQPQRDAIVDYIQRCADGDDAHQRIRDVIQGLRDGRSEFQ